ncbi:hypothetical protein PAXRUDRAFT_155564, partial [Paxillus rubicundulus Ve08.2h10]
MISSTATVEEVQKWTEWNERVHRIIQDSISNALLLKMEMHTTTWDLLDALLSIHQASNLASDKNYNRARSWCSGSGVHCILSASAFYIFQKLFNSAWSGGPTISKHITLLQTLEACLFRMK